MHVEINIWIKEENIMSKVNDFIKWRLFSCCASIEYMIDIQHFVDLLENNHE